MRETRTDILRRQERSPPHDHKRSDERKRVGVRFVPCHLGLRTVFRSETTTVVVVARNLWCLVGVELVVLCVLRKYYGGPIIDLKGCTCDVANSQTPSGRRSGSPYPSASSASPESLRPVKRDGYKSRSHFRSDERSYTRHRSRSRSRSRERERRKSKHKRRDRDRKRRHRDKEKKKDKDEKRSVLMGEKETHLRF